MTTMNRHAAFLLFFSLALLSITLPTPGDAAQQTTPPVRHELSLFFANDVRGETEPCG
ncbi:MAG: hypothetical protein KKG88_07685 [Proteobacteria bacterium]|jgi:hypothetical protein|nr:hypothetical protein [Pseudomonadota bacterium]MBU4230168.1 hypothetical protein [Pseudomonadota bacterium]MBU4408075.1 hypothetical protein [Pseudomonadota bacterium]MBU4412829.1 hypothetical protein [Pseudomonadota bacterium]MCG2823805.1 hypothetical protein [Desulfobulbaceae bacterium]